jgi:SAM-dependent MidA family methyltransferase
MQTAAADAIRARIRDQGPIRFDVFMDLALYGPGGFYERPPVGADGDFVTSPHVHPIFGAFVARALEPLREALANDGDLRLTEVGAGDGTLARQVLEAMPAVAYSAVEVSPGARTALDAIDGIGVAGELRPPADVVLAHELLDNLPFRLVRDGAEVTVDSDPAGFVERRRPLDDELRLLIATRSTDGDLVVPTGALAFIDRVAAVLERGYVLLIDYGGDAAGPVHGYARHQPIEDVLTTPGAIDVTAGVDFGWIAERARARDLHPTGAARERRGHRRRPHVVDAIARHDACRPRRARPDALAPARDRGPPCPTMARRQSGPNDRLTRRSTPD